MFGSDLVIFEEESKRINASLAKLLGETRAKSIFLIDKNGQLIGSCGETQGMDMTSLASLTAGNIAATGGLAQLIGEEEFSVLFHQGERDNLHISIVVKRVILLVIFDERSSLGLVRLRVKRASEELAQIFETIFRKAEAKSGEAKQMMETRFAEITDADIDNLFKT
ncbi:MAG TPA: roadblock/LC7 domain-containing protein [Candidatus Methylomirabilis sp.]